MYKKNIYPTNPCPETPGKTLLNTNVPSTKMLNPKNTFNLFSKYKKYPSNLFIIQKISFTDFSRCLLFFLKYQKYPSLFFIIPQIPSLKLRLFHPDLWFCSACVRLVSLMFCTLFHDAVVSRIYNCSIPMFVHRQLFDTVVSVSVVSDVITKIF